VEGEGKLVRRSKLLSVPLLSWVVQPRSKG